MKTALFLLFTAPLFGGLYIPDGFYKASPEGKNTITVNLSQKRSFTGEKVDLTIKKGRIRALNNQNDQFYCSLTIPHDPQLMTDHYILIYKNRIYTTESIGASGTESSDLTFRIKDKNQAEAVAKWLKLKLHLKKHPGHQLETRFFTDQKIYQKGEKINVTLKITSRGAHNIAFQKGGLNRAARDNQYVFTAYRNSKQISDHGTTNNFGGRSIKVILKPGESFTDQINLSKWFHFDQPGYYTIYALYYLDFHTPDGTSYLSIWEDYVAGQFHFEVK